MGGGVVIRVQVQAEPGDEHVELALLDGFVEHLEVGRIGCQLHADLLHLISDDLSRLQPVGLAGAHPDLAHESLRARSTRVGPGRHAVGPDGPAGLLHQLLGLVDVHRILDHRVGVVGPGSRDDVAPEGSARALRSGLHDRGLIQRIGQRLASQHVVEDMALAGVHPEVDVSQVLIGMNLHVARLLGLADSTGTRLAQ